MFVDQTRVPEPFTLAVSGVPMSGLIAEAENPRAILVAIHGGATTPRYFDAPGNPLRSLMRLGPALGLTIVAPDRPGYGSSRGALGSDVSASHQVDLAFGLVEKVLRGLGCTAHVFLLGHSQGCVLAMRMAADPRFADLLGLELAGTGIKHSAQAESLRSNPAQFSGRPTLRNLLWEPEYLYRDQQRVLSSAPRFDGMDAATWPEEFAALAAKIAVPVRVSLGDHEYWWQGPPDGLGAMARLFSRSERVVEAEQFQSGHNTSLGVSALAYHLKVLAFVEECLLVRNRTGVDPAKLEIHNA